ncbi:MAG TPA: peroxiredoxin family protein [Gemmatimonadaceae bacterium]|jgi:peroxiredoxin Q/BCP
MPRPSSTLRLGDRVPPFQLRDAVSDSTFDLDSLLANHRGLLLVFHRGMWCPNCRRQLAELEAALPSLETAGIRVAAVLAQAWFRVRVSLENLAEPYRFPILCDGDRKVIKAYGVWHPLGIDAFNSAHPASFLIDADRTLRYSFVGSTQFQRAPMSDILTVAERELRVQ